MHKNIRTTINHIL